MCASRIETAWLFHEIGNCFLALGDFEYAKDAAKKSLEAAEEAVEWSYQLQSCVLMGVAEGMSLSVTNSLFTWNPSTGTLQTVNTQTKCC